jgi:cholesterol oxidase
MQMALLKGDLRAKGLHSVVLSQSFAFIDAPWPNRLKAMIRLPDLLAFLNFRPVLTSDMDKRSSFGTRVLDRLLHFYPSAERCGEGVCRRLLFLYGEVIRHDQLDHATHQSLYDMFDRANLRTFSHLAKIFARGHIVNQHGKNTYLTPAAGARVKVPITLLQGMKNGLFRPRGAARTRDWFVAHGGFGGQNADKFVLERVPGYGHLDHFVGARAAADVFPVIKSALDRM